MAHLLATGQYHPAAAKFRLDRFRTGRGIMEAMREAAREGNLVIYSAIGLDRAKVWLDPVRLQESGGFSRSEINRVVSLVAAHQEILPRSWHDYFAD